MEKKQQRFLTIVFAIGASLLFLVACSSTTPPPKSAEKAPVQAQNRTVASQQVRTVAGNPGSSLEAHREGKTPAAGPLKDIYFDFDKYNLSADARDLLKSHAQWLKNNPSSHVQIEGHCDDRGTDEYNLALGAKRARAAKDYLVTLGVPVARISTISYGKELPVCQEQTEECWQRNRHDRFVVQNTPAA